MKLAITQHKHAQQFGKYVDFYYEIFEWFLANKAITKTHDVFDYPKYGGLPKRLSSKMSSLFVDIIQERWPEVQSARSMAQLCRMVFP